MAPKTRGRESERARFDVCLLCSDLDLSRFLCWFVRWVLDELLVVFGFRSQGHVR